MTLLNDLYVSIDRLDRTELEQLRQYIDQRIEAPSVEDERVEAKVKALQEAFAEMRAGLSAEELDEIVEAMNSEYIEPLDPADYSWLADEED